MSNFSEEKMMSWYETPVINAIDVKKNGNQLIITDENGQEVTLTLTDEALRSLPEVLPSPETDNSYSSKKQRTGEYNMELGGSRRRKRSRKHKAIKRHKTHSRRRRH